MLRKLLTPGSKVLATAWSDKKLDPKNTDKAEAIVWVNPYGQGRVCNNAMGHDVAAMKQSIGFQVLLKRGVEWAAMGEVNTPVPEALKATAK